MMLRKQRIVIIDVEERMAYASRKHTWYFQPKSFSNGNGKLIVTAEPFRSAKDIEWNIPQGYNELKLKAVN